MRPARTTLAALACLALAACTTTRRITLRYSPSEAGDSATHRLGMGTVTDTRKPANQPLGTIHSGIGKSTKEVFTTQPLPDVVGEFFVAALRNRDAYAPSSSRRVDVDILKFEANQFVRRKVLIDLLVTLRSSRTATNRATVPVHVEKIQGGLLSMDNLVVGNDVEFQRFISAALSQAADEGVATILGATENQ